MRLEKITCEAYGAFTISATGPILIKSTDETKLTPETADATFLRSGTGDGRDAFVIPGSSIKGVMRHYLETAPDIPKLIPVKNMKAFWSDSFGSTDSKIGKGKISFFDAFADMDTVETSMRYHTKIDAVSQGASRKSLNSVQAVIKGDFRCSYRIRNLTANELTVFAKTMAAFDSGELCIGGRVSRGYGMVRIKDFSMILTNGYDKDLNPCIIRKVESLNTLLTTLEDLKNMTAKTEVRTSAVY